MQLKSIQLRRANYDDFSLFWRPGGSVDLFELVAGALAGGEAYVLELDGQRSSQLARRRDDGRWESLMRGRWPAWLAMGLPAREESRLNKAERALAGASE
jgi:hypothetical protein